MPISRIDGMICLIDRNSKVFCKYNSVWMCEIKEVFENKLIVVPKMELVSAEENSFNAMRKAKEVFAKPKENKNPKQKKTYLYERRG